MVLNAVLPEQDPESEPMFQILKPYRAGCCCFPADVCMGRAFMEVVINGVEVGSIKEHCLCNCNIEYGVYDCNDQLLCTLRRFFCHCECSKKVPFHIFGL